jgi:MerR family copper efflux transcriptional regulator
MKRRRSTSSPRIFSCCESDFTLARDARVRNLLPQISQFLTLDPSPGNALGIGQLAKRGGVGIDTVRYYERSGLLTPRTRLASGYRRYGDTELARLRFIRRAQGLGFTLKEIKQLLALSAQRDVGRVKRSAQTKLLDVEARIAALERVRDGLATLIAACPGHGRAADCPILRALTDEDDEK